jgi:hypothetical protein
MTNPNSTNNLPNNTSGSKKTNASAKPMGRGRKKNVSGDPFEDLNSGWEAQYGGDRFEGYTGKKKSYNYDADSDDGYGYGYSSDADSNDSYESFDRG